MMNWWRGMVKIFWRTYKMYSKWNRGEASKSLKNTLIRIKNHNYQCLNIDMLLIKMVNVANNYRLSRIGLCKVLAEIREKFRSRNRSQELRNVGR